MPESLEDIVQDAKEKKDKAAAVEAAQELDRENVLGKQGEDRPSAFETAAKNVTGGMHDPKSPEVLEEHSNYPQKILASAYEMKVIYKATKKENETFKREKTIDKLTEKENDVIEKIMKDGTEHLDRMLVSLEARGRDDGVRDLASLVTGEQARLAATIPMPGMDAGPIGAFARLRRWATGGPKK